MKLRFKSWFISKKYYFLIIATVIIFFYPIFKGQIPFPGDLLIGEYVPYNSYFFSGYAPGGYPNKGQDFDVLRLLYPEKEFSIHMFKNFELPFWNPYNFSGNPHIASLQSGSFYPLNVIFFILPFVDAWMVFIILQSILTGIFSFLFAREIRLSIKSSFFSALLFTFSSYSIVWMEYGNIGHSIAWMPFAMWMSLRNIKKPSVLKSIAISLSLTFSIMAGYIQTTFYVFVFLLGFIIFHTFFIDKKDRLRKLSIFCLIFILPILLSAIQLLPTLELFSQSARAPYSYPSSLKLLIPTFHAVTMFVPDFFGNPATRNYWINGTYIERVTYIGVIPLIFILYSFFKKQNANFWFFVISASVVLLLTFDTYLAKVIYFFQIPFISTAVPTRMMFLYCFSASIIAGFGLEAFIKEPNKKIFLKVICILGGIYLLFWFFTFIAPIIGNISSAQNLQISRRNLLLPTGIFFVGVVALFSSFYMNKYKKLIIIFLIVLSILDLFYFFHKITPFAPRETIYPQTEVLKQLKKIQGIDRSWGYGSGYVSTNLQTYEKIFSTDGYNALHIKRYGELISASKNGTVENPLPKSDVNLASGYGSSDLKNNFYRKRILDLLGVKYILHKSDHLDLDTFPKDQYSMIWADNVWQIYENKNVIPRFFMANDYLVLKSQDEVLKNIYDKNINLGKTLLLYENPQLSIDKNSQNSINLLLYTPNRVSFRTKSTGNSFVFLSDNYYPEWEALVDKKVTKVLIANYAFRGVTVSKGEHIVEFVYKPKLFMESLKFSVLGIIMVCFMIILIKKYEKQ